MIETVDGRRDRLQRAEYVVAATAAEDRINAHVCGHHARLASAFALESAGDRSRKPGGARLFKIDPIQLKLQPGQAQAGTMCSLLREGTFVTTGSARSDRNGLGIQTLRDDARSDDR